MYVNSEWSVFKSIIQKSRTERNEFYIFFLVTWTEIFHVFIPKLTEIRQKKLFLRSYWENKEGGKISKW